MKQRLVLGLIIFVVAFVGWISRENKQEEEASAKTLADAKDVISRVRGYDEEKEYVDLLVEEAHEQAFRFAYRRGDMQRRWSSSEPASFNDDKYMKWLFIGMASQIRNGFDSARTPRHKPMRDLMKNLDALRQELGVKGLRGI